MRMIRPFTRSSVPFIFLGFGVAAGAAVIGVVALVFTAAIGVAADFTDVATASLVGDMGILLGGLWFAGPQGGAPRIRPYHVAVKNVKKKIRRAQ
jgi:hypothetical protein